MRFSQGRISLPCYQLFLLMATNLRERLRISVSLMSEALRIPSDIRSKSRTVPWNKPTDRTEHDGHEHGRGGVELHQDGRDQAVQDRMIWVRMNDQSASRRSCRAIITKSLACGVGRDAVTSLDGIKEAVRKADENIQGDLTNTETYPD